jgi:hypothetical protein
MAKRIGFAGEVSVGIVAVRVDQAGGSYHLSKIETGVVLVQGDNAERVDGLGGSPVQVEVRGGLIAVAVGGDIAARGEIAELFVFGAAVAVLVDQPALGVVGKINVGIVGLYLARNDDRSATLKRVPKVSNQRCFPGDGSGQAANLSSHWARARQFALVGRPDRAASISACKTCRCSALRLS